MKPTKRTTRPKPWEERDEEIFGALEVLGSVHSAVHEKCGSQVMTYRNPKSGYYIFVASPEFVPSIKAAIKREERILGTGGLVQLGSVSSKGAK